MAKKHYRIHNWKDYNRYLVERGNITLWVSEDVLQQWQNLCCKGKRGRPEKYPQAVIECALALRFLFRLPLRATEGLLQSLTGLLKLSVEVPDYTTLSKRQRSLPLTLKRTGGHRAMDIVLDSSGLKVYGEGEWKRRQHGKSYRRTWRKIHLAVNVQTFAIEGAMLTEASCHDREVLPVLVKSIQAPIGKLIGDGAYDHEANYQYLNEHDIKAIIPPDIMQRLHNMVTASRNR